MKQEKTFFKTDECAKITGVKTRKIAELCADGLINANKKNGVWLVDIEDLERYKNENLIIIRNTKPKIQNSVFGDIALKPDEVMKPITSYNDMHEIFDVGRHEYLQQYFITNYGNVYSVGHRGYLKPDIKDKTDKFAGYYYINAYHKAKNKHEHLYLHRLVAYFFLENRHYKKYVHHIDNNPLNNYYKNLIWVTDAEHKKLHKLLETDKKAYNKYLAELRKDNKQIKCKPVRQDKNNPFLYLV